MSEIFDVAILGAGIGGLTAANELRGHKLIVLEKLHRPGGTSYSFNRNGCEFLTGPLGFSHPEFINSWLKKNKMEVSFSRTEYQLLAGEIDLIISKPLDFLKKDLKRFFPDQNVDKAIEELKKIINKFRGVYKAGDNYFSALENKEKQIDTENYEMSSYDYFSEFLSDEDLIRIISFSGLKKYELSAVASAYMWDALSETGIWYPSTGLRDLIQIIYSRVKENVRLKTKVENILHREHFIIKTDKGEIPAKRVISGIDLNKTYSLMEGNLSEELKSSIGEREVSGSVFTVYIAFESEKIDKSRANAQHVLYYPYLDENNDFRSNRFYYSEVEVTLLSDYARVAPPDREALIIRVPFSYDDCKFSTKEKYYRFKEKTSKELLEIAEPLLPGLTESAVIKDASTPLTYEKWGGRYRGAVAGWQWSDTISECLVKTPIEGFYTCGIYSFSIPFLGAFPTSHYSGRLAANFAKLSSLKQTL